MAEDISKVEVADVESRQSARPDHIGSDVPIASFNPDIETPTDSPEIPGSLEITEKAAAPETPDIEKVEGSAAAPKVGVEDPTGLPVSVSIKDILEAASVAVFGANEGWSMSIGHEASNPDEHITLYDTGGAPPNPKYLLDYPTIQVRIRGSKVGYQAAWQKAKQIKDILLGMDATDVTGNRINSVTMMGDITFLKSDLQTRPIFVVNFQLITEPAATDDDSRSAL